MTCSGDQSAPTDTAPERSFEVSVRDKCGGKLPIRGAKVTVTKPGQSTPIEECLTDRLGKAVVRVCDGWSVAATAFGIIAPPVTVENCQNAATFELHVDFAVEIFEDRDGRDCTVGHVNQGRPLWIRVSSARTDSTSRPRFCIERVSQGEVMASPRITDEGDRYISEFAYDSRRATGRVDFVATIRDTGDENDP